MRCEWIFSDGCVELGLEGSRCVRRLAQLPDHPNSMFGSRPSPNADFRDASFGGMVDNIKYHI